MKFIAKFTLLITIAVLLSACHRETPLPAPSVVDESRIVEIEVKCRAFDDSTKIIKLRVLDVTAKSAEELFHELFEKRFPIYSAYGYSNRNITGGNMPSLHAYGAAIDINEHINPYFDVSKGTSGVIPKRLVDHAKDEKELRESLKSAVAGETELNAVINSIIQASESDDWFINRTIFRKGMLTSKEAKIFARHGFTVWGGDWKRPMDFMHFQIPKKLAERLVTVSKKESDAIWANHLLITKWYLLLEEKLAKVPENMRLIILANRLNRCQLEDDYLSAADKKETTGLCVSDCKRIIKNISKHSPLGL
jgi:hypothetical protein